MIGCCTYHIFPCNAIVSSDDGGNKRSLAHCGEFYGLIYPFVGHNSRHRSKRFNIVAIGMFEWILIQKENRGEE